MLVLGGRAPAWRWGQGSLQEIDHVPFVRPVTKFAATAGSTAEMPGLVDEALAASLQPHSGPTFVDFPLDLVFSEADEPEAGPALPDPAAGPEPDGDDLARAIALLREAERPVIMAGSNLYWAHGEAALQALAEERGIPVFLNGLARGCVARRPRARVLARALDRAQGRRRRARRRRADGLPPRLRPVVRRGDRDRRDRPRRAGPRAPAPGRGGALRRRGRDPGRAADRRARRHGHAPVGERPARRRGRAPGGRGGRVRRRPRAAAPDAALRRAADRARPQRDRDRRRRRLRLLRRARHGLLRAGLLARPGPLRLPRLRAGLRARREARASRAPGRAARSATARSASAAWSSTRSPGTASTSSA